jgi:glutaredoxin-like YruB-family protein
MSKPVTIYTTKTCGYCRAAKAFMDEQGVSYSEIDVGSDPAKAREMIEKSGQMGVPVIVVGDEGGQELIVGFDQKRLSAALGVNG